MKNTLTILILFLFLSSCTEKQTTQVAENTFVYNSKIYKIVDNELTLIGDLNSDSIRKFQVHQPVKREFGECALDFVKPNAHAELNALYRGNSLYFNFYILGLNDLKEEYYPGGFSIYFQDEFGFIIPRVYFTCAEREKKVQLSTTSKQIILLRVKVFHLNLPKGIKF